MIKKVLLLLPSCEKGKVLWQACFFTVGWGIWIERNQRIFREEVRLLVGVCGRLRGSMSSFGS